MALLASPAAIVIALMGATIAGMAFALWKLVERERERIQIDKDAEDLKVAVRRLKLAAGNMALQTADDRREALTRVVLEQRMSLAEQNGMAADLDKARRYVDKAVRSLQNIYEDVADITSGGAQYVRLTMNLAGVPATTSATKTGGVSTAAYSTDLTMDAKKRILDFLNQQRANSSWEDTLKKYNSNKPFLGICYEFAVKNNRKDGDFGRLQAPQLNQLHEALKGA